MPGCGTGAAGLKNNCIGVRKGRVSKRTKTVVGLAAQNNGRESEINCFTAASPQERENSKRIPASTRFF